MRCAPLPSRGAVSDAAFVAGGFHVGTSGGANLFPRGDGALLGGSVADVGGPMSFRGLVGESGRARSGNAGTRPETHTGDSTPRPFSLSSFSVR